MPAVLPMAEDDRTTGPKGSAKKGGEGKPEYTTFRIFAKDGENLSELADKRNTTIAKLYHELFAETVRKLLIEMTEQRLKDLKGRKE